MLSNKLRNIYKYIYFHKKKRLNRNKQGKIFVSHVKIAKRNYYENSDWAYINNQKSAKKLSQQKIFVYLNQGR